MSGYKTNAEHYKMAVNWQYTVTKQGCTDDTSGHCAGKGEHCNEDIHTKFWLQGQRDRNGGHCRAAASGGLEDRVRAGNSGCHSAQFLHRHCVRRPPDAHSSAQAPANLLMKSWQGRPTPIS